jgi:hypothetical protein
LTRAEIEAAMGEAIEAAATDAVKELEADSLETARYPHFAPRRLGETAPHDCRIWRVDYRDPSGGQDGEVEKPPGVRSLDDPETLDQLKVLLEAGLRAGPRHR